MLTIQVRVAALTSREKRFVPSGIGGVDPEGAGRDHLQLVGCPLGDDVGPVGAESSSQQARRFQFPPWARVSIVSPETGREVQDGETGLVRVIDLANLWSVAAVQTEDLAIRRGSGFELLGRAVTAEARGCSLMSANR